MDGQSYKIVKVWKNDYPWDIRVEKIAKALVNSGYEVHLICRNINQLKVVETINGIYIHRFYPLKINFFNLLYSVPVFANPFWLYKIYKTVQHVKANIIIVRDLPLALSALFVGKALKVPVIYDMAENYPAMWKELTGVMQRCTKNPTIAKFIESYVLKRVDHTFVVVEESRKRLIDKGIPPSKISIISNTPDLNKFLHKSGEEISGLQNKFTLVYIGYVNKFRGLDIVIKSLSKLKSKIPEICLIVVGDGQYLDYLKRLAEEHDVCENISFTGWVSFEKVPHYINISDACVVPHYATEHKNTTVPNKLFDYMAYSKPVIVSNAIPLKRIVEEVGCGTVFQSGEVDSFVNATLELWQNPEARTTMGEKGFQAVKNKYNWNVDSQLLVRMIQTMV